jgi:predicted enzyme related to lactoylglutathione lyase
MLDTSSLLDRARELGRARIDALIPGMRASADAAPWAPAAAGPAFAIGTCWTQCTFYAVDDFEAEVGFYLDILGLKAFTLNAESAMISSAKNEFYIGINRADEDQPATNAASLRVQFMVDDIETVTAELEARGVVFDERPAPESDGSPMWFGTLRAPSGVRVDLWGMRE